MTVESDDPDVQFMIGLLGRGGDMLTRLTYGLQPYGTTGLYAAVVRDIHPVGRPFCFASDYLHFHVKVNKGHFAIVQGSIDYSTP